MALPLFLAWWFENAKEKKGKKKRRRKKWKRQQEEVDVHAPNAWMAVCTVPSVAA
jgi:hypothetical protein